MLFLVHLHLVDLVILLCSDIGRVVTGIVHEFLLGCQVRDVRANRVHEILRVGCDDDDVVVSGKVGFKSHDGAEIKMIRRLTEKEEMRFDEERGRQAYAINHSYLEWVSSSWLW